VARRPALKSCSARESSARYRRTTSARHWNIPQADASPAMMTAAEIHVARRDPDRIVVSVLAVIVGFGRPLI